MLSDVSGRERVSSSAWAACCIKTRLSASATVNRPHDIAEVDFACLIRISGMASNPDDTFVQPGDGVERRKDRALLPRRNVGGVLAGKHDPAVDLAQIVVVLFAHFVGPASGAAE